MEYYAAKAAWLMRNVGRETRVDGMNDRNGGVFYPEIIRDGVEARRGTGKAIIAVARKLLGIIYRTLKNDWVFKDFPNYVLETGSAAG